MTIRRAGVGPLGLGVLWPGGPNCLRNPAFCESRAAGCGPLAGCDFARAVVGSWAVLFPAKGLLFAKSTRFENSWGLLAAVPRRFAAGFGGGARLLGGGLMGRPMRSLAVCH